MTNLVSPSTSRVSVSQSAQPLRKTPCTRVTSLVKAVLSKLFSSSKNAENTDRAKEALNRAFQEIEYYMLRKKISYESEGSFARDAKMLGMSMREFFLSHFNLKGLTIESMMRTPLVTADDCVTFAKRNPTLQRLATHQPIDDKIMGIFLEMCPKLTSLSLWDCSQNILKTIITGEKIKVLALFNSIRITDDFLEELAQNHPNSTLETLCIGEHFTDKSLAVVAKNWSNLSYLSIRWCENVTNKTLQAFPENSNLTHLNISTTRKVSTQDILDLTRKCKKLESLICSIGVNISYQDLLMILANCPNFSKLTAGLHLTKEEQDALSTTYPRFEYTGVTVSSGSRNLRRR